MLRLGVLISGRGTNLQAILDAIVADELNARVCLVVSNRADAQGLARSAAAGVPTCVIPHGHFPDRESFDRAIAHALRAAGVEWVVLAGFMRIVTRELLDVFPHRVINIHPSLLPAFPGVDAQAQALRYGVKITGCTVHLVDASVDSGPILAQAAVAVRNDDNVESLAQRILRQEHALLVHTLEAISQGKLRIVPPEEPTSKVRTRIEKPFDVPPSVPSEGV